MDGGSGERDIADTGQKHSTENMINRQMLREGVLLSHSWSSEYPLFLFEKPSTPNNFPCQASPYHFILKHILSYIKMTILIRQKAKLAEHSTFSYSWLWVTGEKKQQSLSAMLLDIVKPYGSASCSGFRWDAWEPFWCDIDSKAVSCSSGVPLGGGKKPQQAPRQDMGLVLRGFPLSSVTPTLEQTGHMRPADGQEEMCKRCEGNPVLCFWSYLLPGVEPAVTMVFWMEIASQTNFSSKYLNLFLTPQLQSDS